VKEGYGLERLARVHTSMAPWKKIHQVQDTDRLCYYLGRDVDALYQVSQKTNALLTDKQKTLLDDLCIPLGHELMEMEYRGVKMDVKALTALSAHLSERIASEMQAMRSMPEVKAFEIAENTTFECKTSDLALVMGKYFKFPNASKTDGGKYSTAAHVLESLSHEPFVQHVQQWRGLTKLKGTYCEGLIERLDSEGVIHGSFRQDKTVTGRLACEDPNLMNQPRHGTVGKVLADPSQVKNCFVARDGCVLLQADASQAELRTLAMYSHDKNLVEIYRKNEDVHLATAAEVFGISRDQVNKEQRNLAKPVNFGIIYGKTLETIVGDFVHYFTQTQKEGKGFQGWDKDRLITHASSNAKKFWDGHKRTFPDVWRWMDEQERTINKQNYQETFFGRKRFYDYINDKSVREAYNFPIQSTASDFTLFSLVRTAKALRHLKIDAHVILTVHDSIVYEVRLEQFWQAVDVIKHIAENLNFSFMNVPLLFDFEAGFSWGSMKKVDPAKRTIG
jgi:DNA polymerase-1